MRSVSALQTKYQALPALDFLLLLGRATGRSKERLLAHPEYCPTAQQRGRLAYYLGRYRQGYAVAVIVHHQEFFGLDFYVNQRVLVPRPETELLVQEAIDSLTTVPESFSSALLIDIGTGSGCIPIAIAKNFPRPLTIVATDISRRALRVAKKNARTHKVSIKFLSGGLLKPIITHVPYSMFQVPLVIITANLPYLTTAEFASEPSIRREPRQALVADTIDGLSLYERLLPPINRLISHLPGISISVLLEISPPQSLPLTALIKKCLPGGTVETKTDLAGRERLVIIHFNTKTLNS